MISGSCVCSAVKWQYDGALNQITHCHCAMCRKNHGSAFATYAVGEKAPFSYIAGTDCIVEFESSPGFIRSFCKHCGSTVPNTKLEGIVAIPVGSADGELGRMPDGHIFAKWKAPWYSITDALPQHDNYPGQAAPAVDRPSEDRDCAGTLKGGCLCGAVRFELRQPFKIIHHCHCSRCRKGRAAAHASNGISDIPDLRFIQGEQHISKFRLQDAQFFGQWFCSKCGSPTPRIDAGRNIAITPMGALDDAAICEAADHIYVGSKAAWFEITDSLPQFQAAPE